MSEWVSAGKVRMTPKGEYDPTAPYEILDVVSNVDGTAFYIAKKAVPAGTVLTNTEYWAVVIDVSDISIDVENEINAVNDIATNSYPTYSINSFKSVVTIEDGADGVPIKSASLSMSPRITGHTGVTIRRNNKNLWPEVYDPAPVRAVTYKYVLVGDNTVTLSTNMPRNTSQACNLFLLSGKVDDGALSSTNGVSADIARTVAATDGYVTIGYRNADGVDPINYHVQLEFGSIPTTYVHSQSQNECVVDWEDEAGTVYGCTLDLNTGAMTVDTILFESTWGDGTDEGTVGSTITHKSFVLPEMSKSSGSDDGSVCNLCSYALGNSETEHFYIIWQQVGVNFVPKAQVYLLNDTAQDQAIKIAYKVRTTIPYQIGPQAIEQIKTLLGYNTIYADAGKISLTYHIDPTISRQYLEDGLVDISTDVGKLSSAIFGDKVLVFNPDGTVSWEAAPN